MNEVRARGSICGKCIPARYVLAILGSMSMAITYALKVNLSIAMVAMLNHTALLKSSDTNETHSGVCPSSDSAHEQKFEDGPFIWSEALQGSILSSYFWGYLIAQIPGGRLAEIYSAKWVMFGSVIINIVGTVLTPISANIHYALIIVMRVAEGLGGGVTFPAMHVMLAHWAPPPERTFIANIVYAGTCLGTVVSILAAGLLASTLGWEYVFYIMGAACVPWCLLWVWLVQDTPETQPYISEEERQYILKSLGVSDGHSIKHLAVPWKAVFTSACFWAILISHICNNWGWYMVLIELPFYMKQVLNFNIKENALLTAVPYFSMWLFSMMLGKILDTLRSKNILSTTQVRKIATAIASIIPGAVLISLCFIGCIRWLAVLLMTVAITAYGGMFSGVLSNHIDIAPNFAGTLVALTNTIATVPGIIVPIFVGYLTHTSKTMDAWFIIFTVTTALFAVEIIVYCIFGSGEQQPWNEVDTAHENQPLNQSVQYRSNRT